MLQMKKEKFNTEENENEKGPENHTVLGMCFGMVAGSVAMSILAMFGQILWGGMCIAAGLFLGALIGAAIPKKKQTNSCLPGKPKNLLRSLHSEKSTCFLRKYREMKCLHNA